MLKNRRRFWLPVFSILMFALSISAAGAQTPGNANVAPGTIVQLPLPQVGGGSDVTQMPVLTTPQGQICPNFPGVTGRVVHCIQNAVLAASSTYLGYFYTYLKDTINAVLIIGTILYGIMLATGKVEQPTKDSWIFIFKMSAILYFTANFTMWWAMFMNMTQGAMDVLSDSEVSQSYLKCGNGGDVWARLDCMLNLVFGITPDLGLKGGIVAIVMAFIFSSANVGIFLFLLGFSFMLSMVFSVLRATFIFLSGFMALALLALFSPLIIPLILFQYTKPMFDRWLKMAMGFLLQPIFLVAYLTLMITAFDKVVFSGDTSIFRTMLGPNNQSQLQNPNFSMGKFFSDNQLIMTNTLTAASLFAEPSAIQAGDLKEVDTKLFGKMKQWASRQAYEAVDGISKTLGFSVDIGYKINMVKWVQVSGYANYETLRNRLLVSFITAALMAYIMYTTLLYVPAMGTEMANGALDGMNLSSNMPGSKVGNMMPKTR